MSRRVLPLVASLLVLAFFTVGGMARRTTTTTTVPRTSRGRGAPDQQYSCTSSLGFDLIIPISDTTFNCLPGALLQDRQDPRRWMIQCYAAIGYGTAQRTLVSTLLMVDGKVTALNRTISGGVLSVSQDPLTNTVFFYNELDPQTPNNLYTMQFADTFEQAQATIQAHVVGIQIAALVAWANSALVVDLSVTELDLYNQAGRWQPQTVLTNIAASNGFNQDSANYLGVAILAVQSPQPAFYSVELPKYLNSSWGAPIKLATYSDCQGAQATLISSEILVISCADTGIFALNLTSNTTTPIITALLCQQNSLLRYDRQSDTMILGCANNILMVQHLQQRPLPAQIATVPFASDTVCSQLQDAAVDHTTGQWLLSCGNGVFHATGFSASPIVSNIPGCPNLSGLEYDGTRGIFYINCNGGGLFAVRNGHVEPLITPTPPALCSSPSSMAVDSVTGYLYLLCGTSMVRFNGTDAIQFAVVPGQVDDLEVYDGILYQLSNSQLLYYNLTSPTSSEWTTIPATYVGAFWAHADTAYIVTGVPPQDSVYAINLLTGNSTTWTCTGNCAASGIFGDPLRGLLFVTDEFFKIVDMKTMAVLVHLPAPPWAGYQDQNVVIAQDEITQLLYVARPEGLFSIDPTLGLKGVWTLLPTNGNCPTTIGLIYDPLTSVLFTACATTGTILASASKFRCGNGFAWTGAGCSACLVGSAVSVSPADLFSFDILQCQPCPSGSIAPWSGMASCEICQPGSFDDASLTEVCSLCAPGRHQNVSGQATCVECENGKFSSGSGAVECTPCAPGSYSSSLSKVVCLPCPAGQFSSAPGSKHCQDCPAGRFSGSLSSTECALCTPGRYAVNNRSVTCTDCSRNSFNNQTGSSQLCTDCAPGSTAETFGSTFCTPCGLGYSSSNSGGCTLCAPDTYTPLAGSVCVSCDSPDQVGLKCSGGLASVEEGSWAYLELTSVPGVEKQLEVYVTAPCPQFFCPAKQLQLDAHQMNSSSLNGTITYCEAPRLNDPQNWLCGECTEGYIPWGEECVVCDGVNPLLLVVLIVLCFGIAGFLLLTSFTSAGVLSVLIFYVQIALLQIRPLQKSLLWMNISLLSPHSFNSCIAPLTPLQQTALTCAAPVLLAVALTLCVGIQKATRKWRCWWCLYAGDASGRSSTDNPAAGASTGGAEEEHKQSGNSARSDTDGLSQSADASTSDWSRYIGALLSLLLFSYTPVSTAVLNALHCVDVGPVRLLFAAPSVDCRSNEYEHAFIWLMTIAIVFVLGFPIALLIVLRVNRRAVMQTVLLRGRENGNGVVTFAAQPEKDKRSNKLSLHEAESSSTLLEMEIVGDAVDKAAIASFALKLGPSFAMYSAHAACWWGPLLLLRRLAFVFVSVFLSGSRQTVLQPTLFAALSLTSLLGHFTVQPFHARRLNLLEGTCTSLLAYLSLILAAEPPPFSAFWQVILALLLMVPTSLMLIVVVYEFVRARLRQLRAVAKRRRKERAARIGGSEPRVSPHSTRGGAPSRSVYGSTADASPGALYYEPPSSDDGVAAGTPTSHHSLNGGDDVLHVDVPEEFKEEDEDREARL